jgi:hypothetical protein
MTGYTVCCMCRQSSLCVVRSNACRSTKRHTRTDSEGTQHRNLTVHADCAGTVCLHSCRCVCFKVYDACFVLVRCMSCLPTLQEMEERFALDMAGACSRISSRQPRPAVLVLHGGCDPICQASDAAQLARSIAGERANAH